MSKYEKEAEKYASKDFQNKSSFEYHNQYTSFIAGAEHVKKEYEEKLRWIPVGEKLPEIEFGKWRTEIKFCIKLKSGRETTAYFTESKFKGNSLYFGADITDKQWIISDSYDQDYKTKIEVTHWHSISFL